MINLEDVSLKIKNVINGNDPEVDDSPGIYDFRVFTEGFYIDNVYDMKTGENFIPVFIGSLGGEYNPIKGLEEQNYNTSITFYFPVRLKEDIKHINKFIYDCFCGSILTYGEQKARSNISVAQYGEIQDVDFEQFRRWVETTYKMPVKQMDSWMSMTITLYLTTVKKLGEDDGFMFGESFKISNVNYDGDDLNDVIYISHTSNVGGEVVSEQILGTELSHSLISGNNQVFEFPFYLKNDSSYKKLIDDYMTGNISNKNFIITYNIFDTDYEKTFVIQNASIHVTLGEILGISLTLTPKVEE